MGSSIGRKVVLVAFGALAFGVAMSVLKGNDGGAVRNAIGNLSAPWLLLPFLAGAYAAGGRVGVAALLGALVSLLALAGFYGANSFVLHLGPHPWLDDLRLSFGGFGYFFPFALVSGPLFGALGGWWRQTRSRVVAVLVAAMFVLEPFAVTAYDGSLYTSDGPVWAGEVLVGFVGCTLAGWRTRRVRPPGRS